MNNDLLMSYESKVGFLVLNRPQLHNAICRAMWEKLPEAVSQLQEGGAKVIVVTGQGPSFASGADLAELESLRDLAEARSYWQAIRDALNSLFVCRLPTVAMIDGPCLGGGCLIALACDLRFASDRATFALPAARLGILLDDENIARLVSIVGPAVAKELLFRANTISARQAQEIGLTNDVSKRDLLRPLVLKVANEIAHNVDASVLFAKQAVNRCCHSWANSSIEGEKLIIQSYLNPELNKKAKSNSSPGKPRRKMTTSDGWTS